jgi:16S rRNA (adenine1518-N6/adenine1519-N6)-dimethyltransferase
MSVARVQTKREIQEMLAAAGVRPDKRFGQHFLVDGNLMRKMVETAEIGAGDTILEVGGGTGGLTDLLAPVAHRVVVVEIHRELAVLLATRFADAGNVRVIAGDVLSSKHTVSSAVSEALAVDAPPVRRVLLVANLPYNVATPLIMNLLVDHPLVDRLCFTIQREVADRLTGKDFGPLAILVQTLCHVRRIAVLPASAFWPPPSVESSMLRLDRRPHPFANDDALRAFVELVKAAFAHRRKTLRFNLGRHLSAELLDRAASTVDLGRRAEAIALDQWIRLGRELAR